MRNKKMRDSGCILQQGKFRLEARKKIVHIKGHQNLEQVALKDWGIFSLENIQNKWTMPRAAHVSSKLTLVWAGSWTRSIPDGTEMVWNKGLEIVLGLTGMGLTFFRAALMVLCFASVAKMVLATHQCLSYCWTVLAQHQARRLGGEQEAGRRHNEDSWHILTIPYDVTLRNKSSGKGEGRGDIHHGYGIHYACEDPAFQEVPGHLLDYGM